MVGQNGGQIFFVLGFMSAPRSHQVICQMHRPLGKHGERPSVKASRSATFTAATKVLNEPLLTAVL
jgi:hypothetical protein